MKTLRPYQQYILHETIKYLSVNIEPAIINASVGAGKSLIIAELLKYYQAREQKVLCLTMNSTLIKQNHATFNQQSGMDAGIYCSMLNKKDADNNIIFASPNSVINGLNSQLGGVRFNLIVIDECHNINPKNNKSMYMRIFNHYGLKAQTENYKYNILGLTGTPYRDNNISIIGESKFFKQQLCSVSTQWLIDKEFLVPPVWGQISTESYDMAKIKVNKLGKFSAESLTTAINKKPRLTAQIMQDVINVVESGYNGAFIFASTVTHAKECLVALPENAAIVTAETKAREREDILDKARSGEIKYLVNVATLLTGVDVPNFDVCAWLRPTESLTLYTQGIGRVLRLHEGKKQAVILDYAGNLQRHGDIDNPFIINALISADEQQDVNYCIPCSKCETLNPVTSRRCIGYKKNDNQKIAIRCDYYFIFKKCDGCGIENDTTAKHCRACNNELIDPNKKLNINNAIKSRVKSMGLVLSWSNLIVVYKTEHGDVFEYFGLLKDNSLKIFYHKFLKIHFSNPSKYYRFFTPERINRIISSDEIKTPAYIYYHKKDDGQAVISKKLFSD